MKGMVTNMNEIIISIVIGIAQIVLSSFLILRHKNKFAIASEIITSGLLFYILYNIEKIVSWNYILLVVIEFLLVKIFLIVFWIIVRVYSFYLIRSISKSKKKTNKKRAKIANKFYKVKYFPRLKLGIPGKANKTIKSTKVKFDSKGFPKFESYYTVKLRRKDFRKSRETHFNIANKKLYNAISSNSRLRSKFTKQDIKKISQGETPNKYTWHHHQDSGVLELVDSDIHSKTSHVGGYSIWGGK